MDHSENSTNNMVFAQPLSHEQLQNNREVLARRLQLRRPREELVNQGIMPAVSAAPSILQQKTKLERAQKSDILQRKIRVRPNRNQLIQRHILEDTNVDASLQARQISLKRKKLQDDLNERLLMRPGPLELVNKNILEPGSFVGQAIKEGAVEYSDTKDSHLIKNALSPPESVVADDSPQPSPDNTSSIGSPPDISQAASVFSLSTTSADAQVKAFSGSQVNLSQASQLKPKEPKSRKKSSKAKFKKYKYHEYRPPNTESSSSKSDSLPADSPYSLLLQQQQLYLQLQVLCQNYPQTFLPLMPVQKSNQADNSSAEKPMKLEEMRVIDLRNELKSRGLPVSGSKNHLMERLKLANAGQLGGTNTPTCYAPTSVPMRSDTSAVATFAQSTPVQGTRTALSRSTSAPTGVALGVNPGKVLSDAEKILQSEQNISVGEIQQKIQQLQYLNLQIQLQQLDLKKNQQLHGKQQLPTILPNQPQLQQLQLQQLQQQQLQQQTHQENHQQQQQGQQHLQQEQQLQQQLKQLQQQQLQQHLQQQLQQQQQQLKQHLDQQRLCNLLPVSQASNQLSNVPVQHQNVLQEQQHDKPSTSKPDNIPTSLPPPQQCQVSISATPLLHCSALTCTKNCYHGPLSSTAQTTTNASNTQAGLLNSVQQHNVIHFKQPVKPVIILQPPKQQQRAELLFSPPAQELSSDIANDAFFQQLNKATQDGSISGDMTMDHDSNWHGIVDGDSTGHSHSNSPTAQRSPPPYFEAVAGRLSPRSTSFSGGSVSTSPTNFVKSHPNQKSLPASESNSSFGHRRSLSVPSVNPANHGVVQPRELQKGHKSASMCFDLAETDEACGVGDNYHGITQELQKAMMIESQNNLDNRSAELLEILGDAFYSTTPTSGMSSSSPNLTAFSPYPQNRQFNAGSSPKGPRSPTIGLPSYQEALQNSLCVQSPPGNTNFGSNELLNGYREQSSPVNIGQHPPGNRKGSSPNLEDNFLANHGSPMKVDHEDMDLLQRGVLDANGYRRDSFNMGELRTHNVQNNSLYHVNPSAIFGNPVVSSADSRMVKQEDGLGVPFLDMDATGDFPDMDFGMGTDAGISMSGITFSR